MTTFDPEAPLPDAPDPWAGSEMPAWRDAPPYAMTEMIAAEPALAERLLLRLQNDPALARVADAVRTAAAEQRPMIMTGCGTSEHAAMIAAALLSDALDGPTVWPMRRSRLAAATNEQRGRVVIGRLARGRHVGHKLALARRVQRGPTTVVHQRPAIARRVRTRAR